MPRRDPNVTLRQMLDHSREAVGMVKGRSRQDLDSDRMLNLSLVRLLEVVGEAANRVPSEIRSRHGVIPWGEIVALRNRLIHGYDQVDLDVLWQIVTQDLPPLVSELERIVPPEGTAS